MGGKKEEKFRLHLVKNNDVVYVAYAAVDVETNVILSDNDCKT